MEPRDHPRPHVPLSGLHRSQHRPDVPGHSTAQGVDGRAEQGRGGPPGSKVRPADTAAAPAGEPAALHHPPWEHGRQCRHGRVPRGPRRRPHGLVDNHGDHRHLLRDRAPVGLHATRPLPGLVGRADHRGGHVDILPHYKAVCHRPRPFVPPAREHARPEPASLPCRVPEGRPAEHAGPRPGRDAHRRPRFRGATRVRCHGSPGEGCADQAGQLPGLRPGRLAGPERLQPLPGGLLPHRAGGGHPALQGPPEAALPACSHRGGLLRRQRRRGPGLGCEAPDCRGPPWRAPRDGRGASGLRVRKEHEPDVAFGRVQAAAAPGGGGRRRGAGRGLWIRAAHRNRHPAQHLRDHPANAGRGFRGGG
mmetsp:Transcript_139173/g.433036  ORF Transcript_139173/g.433036 Transcript_139173/m.433036 type:complete len:363 (-) Transcript_139173:670-1758(-)